jgi:hypothetical protein
VQPTSVPRPRRSGGRRRVVRPGRRRSHGYQFFTRNRQPESPCGHGEVRQRRRIRQRVPVARGRSPQRHRHARRAHRAVFQHPAGEGYAYAEGPTVAIGYIPQYSGPGDPSLASWQEPAKEIFTRIVAAAAGTPIPANGRPETGIDTYAPGRGRYTTPDDPGWIFLQGRQLGGNPCGIGPNGSLAGCDIVPKMNVPSGANQTVVDASAPARYAYSDTPTFTRDVDVLLEGHRLENGDATCGLGYQGTVHCVIGEHSFVVSSIRRARVVEAVDRQRRKHPDARRKCNQYLI